MLTTFKNYTFKTKPVNALKVASIAIVMGMTSMASAGNYTSAYTGNFSVSEKIQFVVKTDDLKAPQGAVKVYDALSTEARSACTPKNMRFSKRVIDSCADDLLDQFVDDLSVPDVTKLHEAPEA